MVAFLTSGANEGDGTTDLVLVNSAEMVLAEVFRFNGSGAARTKGVHWQSRKRISSSISSLHSIGKGLASRIFLTIPGLDSGALC